MKILIKVLLALTSCLVIIGFGFVYGPVVGMNNLLAHERDRSLSGPVDEGMKAYRRQDWQTALRLWRSLADQGNAAAENNIAVLYDNGLGVQKNAAEAMKWFRKSAERGDLKAEMKLGLAYDIGLWGMRVDNFEAIKWYRKAAEQGDTSADLKIGWKYEIGSNDVKQDPIEAKKWYLKAAELGDARGLVSIGRMYKSGNGIKRDDVEAAQWIRKAANSGDVEARDMLVDLYMKGDGVHQDYTEAYFWCRIGLRKGTRCGSTHSDDDAFLERFLTPAQIAAVKKRAEEWKPIPVSITLPTTQGNSGDRIPGTGQNSGNTH